MTNPETKNLIEKINKIVDYDIRLPYKKREVVFARYVFFEILHSQNKYSMQQIGALVNVSHSTVSFGLQRIIDLETDETFIDIKNAIKSTNPDEKKQTPRTHQRSY